MLGRAVVCRAQRPGVVFEKLPRDDRGHGSKIASRVKPTHAPLGRWCERSLTEYTAVVQRRDSAGGRNFPKSPGFLSAGINIALLQNIHHLPYPRSVCRFRIRLLF